jgi:hypothetical protein
MIQRPRLEGSGNGAFLGMVFMESGNKGMNFWYLLTVGTFAAGLFAFGAGTAFGVDYDPYSLSWIILGTGLILFLGLPLLFRLDSLARLIQSIPQILRRACLWAALLAFALLLGMGLGASLSTAKQSFPIWLWAGIMTGALAGIVFLILLVGRNWQRDSSALRPWEIGLGIANLAGLLLVVIWSNWTAQPPPEAFLLLIMLGMAVVVLLGLIRLADIHKDRDVIPDAAGILFGTLGLLLVGVML